MTLSDRDSGRADSVLLSRFWGSPHLVDSGLGPGALGRFLTFKAFFLRREIP